MKYEDNPGVVLKETEARLKSFHTPAKDIEIACNNLKRLHQVVFEDQPICSHTETHGDQERMLEIFVRANSGGEPLTRPELLLSNLTVHWKALDARHEVKEFVDEINASLNKGSDQSRIALKQDLILKCCLVLLDLPVAYRISSFNKRTCEQIEGSWTEIKKCLRETAEVANWFGITGGNLTSANALIPIAYYLYRNSDVRLRGDGKEDAQNASLVRRWLIMALLNGIFGGSSDSMLSKARSIIMKHGEHGRPFPVPELDAAIKDLRRLPTTDPDAIRTIPDLKYGDSATFLALTLLFDERAWGTIVHHCDHIFPQSLFKQQLKQFKEDANQLANLTLLNAKENLEKNAKPFDQWIRTRESAFLERHFIPQDDALWRPDAFPHFLQERRRLVLDRLFHVLGAELEE